MEDKYKSAFSEIIELHNDFSLALKIVENFTNEIDTTTLNDSRYALRAVIDCIEVAVKNDHDVKFQSSHASAITALRIAWHDIVDIMYKEFKIYLDTLAEKYGPDLVDDSIKNLSKCKQIIRKIEDLVALSRGNRSKRVELYREITVENLKNMLDLYRECKDSEPSIARRYKKEKHRNYLAVAAFLTAFSSACMILYFNAFDNMASQKSQAPLPELNK